MRPGVPQNRNAPDVPKEQCFFFFCTERSAVPLVGLVVSPARQGRRPDGKSGARFYDRGMERSSVESRLSELVHAAVPPSDLAVAAIVAGVPVEQTRPTGLRNADLGWTDRNVQELAQTPLIVGFRPPATSGGEPGCGG